MNSIFQGRPRRRSFCKQLAIHRLLLQLTAHDDEHFTLASLHYSWEKTTVKSRRRRQRRRRRRIAHYRCLSNTHRPPLRSRSVGPPLILLTLHYARLQLTNTFRPGAAPATTNRKLQARQGLAIRTAQSATTPLAHKQIFILIRQQECRKCGHCCVRACVCNATYYTCIVPCRRTKVA